jgi:hypothetical protein
MTEDRVPLSLADLEQHLAEQIGFLGRSADSFDSGFDEEAKRLAVTLRVLLHDWRQSRSLLGQLQRLDGSFVTTAQPLDAANMGTHGGLVMFAASGRETKYVAMLDSAPFVDWRPFEEWWAEPVFRDDRRQTISRSRLVLAVADQDGGAHVDPTLDATYARLSRGNSLAWVQSDGATVRPIPNAERAAVRQIAHEVLRTLLPAYRKRPDHKGAFISGDGGIYQGNVPPPIPRPHHFDRNDPCPCGGGKKFKKCHGAG